MNKKIKLEDILSTIFIICLLFIFVSIMDSSKTAENYSKAIDIKSEAHRYEKDTSDIGQISKEVEKSIIEFRDRMNDLHTSGEKLEVTDETADIIEKYLTEIKKMDNDLRSYENH